MPNPTCFELLQIIGPNVMLPVMVTLWGLVTALQGKTRMLFGGEDYY